MSGCVPDLACNPTRFPFCQQRPSTDLKRTGQTGASGQQLSWSYNIVVQLPNVKEGWERVKPPTEPKPL